MMKQFLTMLFAAICAVGNAQSAHDTMAPFGFATCTSRTATGYGVTGGGATTPAEAYALTGKKVVTMLSNGAAMDSEILNAITENDVVIFDGSNGDFIVKEYVILSELQDKTLLGINNAKFSTQWHATADDIQALEDAGVSSMSTGGDGGTLSNGQSVREQAELNSRQIMINRYNDQTEWWRKSGVFFVKGCSNLIIRNITFQGPGAVDLGGADLVSITENSQHIWIDHCDFADGQDGNMDITYYSDFITVSWCVFHYTDRSYMHQNTNLCGSSDSRTGDDDKLSVTWAYNHWSKGCAARMPMARFGRFHLLNNYYDCTGNKTACMNPRLKSETLIEGNYFDASLTNVYESKDATQVIWRSNNSIANTSVTYPVTDDETPTDTLVPYPYTIIPTADVPSEVGNNAGATLFTKTAQ